MIWVLSGTKDAREIIKILKREGFMVLASSVSRYGASLAKDSGADEAVVGALNCDGMKDLILKKKIKAVIDATHPFAVEASKNAIKTCEDLHITYIRFERKATPLSPDSSIYTVKDFEDAAKKAKKFERIFYTAGSKNLEKFLNGAGKGGKRIIVRILPTENDIKRCLQLGIEVHDIIAMLGPFSIEMNEALMKEYNTDVLVTKESGEVGGVKAKITAALNLGISVILIQRPRVEYPAVVQDYKGVLEFLPTSIKEE